MPVPKFNDDVGLGGHFSTTDATLAAVLGAMHFIWRGSAPIMFVVHSNRVARLVDRGTGEIEDTARIGFYFDAKAIHPTFGEISAHAVAAAFERRRILTLREKGEFVPPSRTQANDRAVLKHKVTAAFYEQVRAIVDGIDNLLLLSAAITELAQDPLIQVAKSLRKGRLDFLRPLEVEPVAQRAMERFGARHH
jgi:hypothetical protein